MKSIIRNSLGSDAFCLLGPTGVSALNINGSTIHSKLHIHPKTREVLPLKGTAVHEFRKKFENVHFVLIDEYSMVGCNMLNLIEKRLKEAMDRDNEPYGGVFTFFFW
ncbi:uncharacterized protein LOC127751410 [Frankliniella occidentalis]|uniref:ATP-dependent DNA helicase n=1 Tax=Frankliniella occidentalis TaxID=133901 RepID=A0A9C6XU27_FRAOC|nr:uncharacterized protein LOC127751410 [Frankliniella occidentalis]